MRLLVLLLLFLSITLHQASTQVQSKPIREQRWTISGEPYQQRVVSLIPGNVSPLPWSQYYPPSSPIPEPLPLPVVSPPYPLQQPLPLAPIPAVSQFPWFMPPPPNMQNSPWPPIPRIPSLNEPQSSWPPVAPLTYVAPTTVFSGPQESSSRDLDVGVYTGMDSPWTQLPPFSQTINMAPTGLQSNPILMQPWESSSRDLDVGVATGNEVAQRWPYQAWQANSRVPLYPWMRQQGGFALKRADDDLKLTMHVPKDGLPGGVLVMEMKASVYRPVY